MRVSSCAEFHEILAVFNYENLDNPLFPNRNLAIIQICVKYPHVIIQSNIISESRIS